MPPRFALRHDAAAVRLAEHVAIVDAGFGQQELEGGDWAGLDRFAPVDPDPGASALGIRL